jgi:TonB family protein
MKLTLAVALLALALSLCNLMSRRGNENANVNPKQGTLSVTDAPATKEAAVQARINELFELCRAGRNAEAAKLIMYRGLDPNRKGKDVANYEDSNEKDDVDRRCEDIKARLAASERYDFGNFQIHSKSDGSEVATSDVRFHRGFVAVAEKFSFSLVNGNYFLVDADPQRNIGDTSTVPPVSSGPLSVGKGTNSNRGVPQIADAPPPPPPPSPKPTPRAPISGGVLNGKATRLVQPAYPAIARAAHASGQVRVQVLVDENGNVVSATPVSGHPLLQSSAAAAARQSKFSPTMLSGQPVKVTGVIIYNFVAQ